MHDRLQRHHTALREQELRAVQHRLRLPQGYFACTNNTCVCRAKSSKNLVPNARFDTNVSGWISQENMATWSSVDADGCPASGSITAPQGDVLEYCVQNLLPNTTYYLGYKYIQDQANGVDCFVTWTSDTACQNDISKFDTLSSANTGSAWSSASNLGTSGAGTVAAYIQCLLNANANIDQIYPEHSHQRFLIRAVRAAATSPRVWPPGDRFAAARVPHRDDQWTALTSPSASYVSSML